MIRSLAFALAALALVTGSADARTVRYQRPTIKSVCAGEVLPFPVPDLTEATDSAYASWMEGAWNDYCADARTGSYEAAVCTCRPSFDW